MNTVTHYLMPVAVVLDWLYQPPLSKLAVKQISYWLIFPLLLGYPRRNGGFLRIPVTRLNSATSAQCGPQPLSPWRGQPKVKSSEGFTRSRRPGDGPWNQRGCI